MPQITIQPILRSSLSTSSVITTGGGSASSDPVFTIAGAADFTGPAVDEQFIQWDADSSSFVMAAVGFLQKTSNLSDLTSVSTARDNLGLGSIATLSSVSLTSNVSGTLPVSNGGTGGTSYTSTQLIYGNGTSALSSSSSLTWDNSTSLLAISGKQTITSNSSSAILLSIKGAASHSGNYLQCKDSSDSIFFAVQSDKSLLLPPAASNGSNQSLTFKTDGTQWGNAELHIQRNTSTNNGLGTHLKLTDNGVSAYIKFISRSFTQAVNDLEFWSQSGLNISMPYSGGTYIYQPVQNTQKPALLTAPAQTVYPGGGTPSPQGAFIFEDITWAATSSTTIADVAGLLIKSAPIVGVNMTITRRYSGLLFTNSAGAVGVGVRGHASQSANLQQWEDSSANTLAAITANGAFKPASLADSSAANGTLYYSTTASKLVFKDGAGVVNNLY